MITYLIYIIEFRLNKFFEYILSSAIKIKIFYECGIPNSFRYIHIFSLAYIYCYTHLYY